MLPNLFLSADTGAGEVDCSLLFGSGSALATGIGGCAVTGAGASLIGGCGGSGGDGVAMETGGVAERGRGSSRLGYDGLGCLLRAATVARLLCDPLPYKNVLKAPHVGKSGRHIPL
jgi:hypothetical protein